MGTLIPLFHRKRTPTKVTLSPEQELRVKLITNSLEALKREERAIEEAITTKCREEIERLHAIDSQVYKLKSELEELTGLPWPGPSYSKG